MQIINFFFLLTNVMILGINVLSPYSLVSQKTLALLAGFSFVIFVIFLRKEIQFTAKRFFFRKISKIYFWVIFFILIFTFFQALVYPPNNWDSMTYHMSRIVYWIQNNSIEYFETNNPRQNVLTPGAELILFIPQILFQTDRFANLLQWFSFLVGMKAIWEIFCLFGVSYKKKQMVLVLYSTIPMSILQSSSTQNDLLASSLALCALYNAIVLKRNPYRTLHWINFGSLLSLTFLVKPTGVIALTPYILFYFLYRLNFRHEKKFLLHYILLIIIFGLTNGFDLYRKYKATNSFSAKRHEIFLLTDPIQGKLINGLTGFFYHVPFEKICETDSFKFLHVLSPTAYSRTNPCKDASSTHEDSAGNPLHLLVLFGTLFLGIFHLQKRNFSKAVFSVLPFCSWFIFHSIVKDQPWISRLQLPIFALMPLGLLHTEENFMQKYSKPINLCLTFSILYAFFTIFNNESRPFKKILFEDFDRKLNYYNNYPALYHLHTSVLNQLEEKHCKKLGLFIGDNSWDYPLAWQAYKKNIRVKHLTQKTENDHFCMVFSEKGNPNPTKWTKVTENIFIPQN